MTPKPSYTILWNHNVYRLVHDECNAYEAPVNLSRINTKQL